MNIEVHDLDSLRKLIRKLQSENRRLKEQLRAANIAFDTEEVFEEKPESMEENTTRTRVGGSLEDLSQGT